MRLKITKSKNNVHYSIIKDYTPLNGKRTTKVYENLGNQKKLKKDLVQLIHWMKLKNMLKN